MPLCRRPIGACPIAASTLMAAIAVAAADPGDAERTADHPEVLRFPGFHIDNSKTNDFNEALFASKGYDDSGEPKGETESGRYWFIDYMLNGWCAAARQRRAGELLTWAGGTHNAP